jgi:hypothetical protein
MKKDAQFGALDLLAYMAGPAVWIFAWRGEKVVYIPGGTLPRIPARAHEGEYQVLRGGSWYFLYDNCRVSDRDGASELRNYFFGFRLGRHLTPLYHMACWKNLAPKAVDNAIRLPIHHACCNLVSQVFPLQQPRPHAVSRKLILHTRLPTVRLGRLQCGAEPLLLFEAMPAPRLCF